MLFLRVWLEREWYVDLKETVVLVSESVDIFMKMNYTRFPSSSISIPITISERFGMQQDAAKPTQFKMI